jgi:hypothetical protein
MSELLAEKDNIKDNSNHESLRKLLAGIAEQKNKLATIKRKIEYLAALETIPNYEDLLESKENDNKKSEFLF